MKIIDFEPCRIIKNRLRMDPIVEHADQIIEMIEQAQSDFKDQEIRRKMKQREAEREQHGNIKKLLPTARDIITKHWKY